MKKILLSIFFLFSLSANAMEKETTFKKELFDKAQSDGKTVVISSWIKYCPSCAGQMKILQNAKNSGELLDIKFDNIEYFSFDVTKKEISNLFDVSGTKKSVKNDVLCKLQKILPIFVLDDHH